MSIPFGTHTMTVVEHGLFEAENDKHTPYVGINFDCGHQKPE